MITLTKKETAILAEANILIYEAEKAGEVSKDIETLKRLSRLIFLGFQLENGSKLQSIKTGENQ